MPLSQKTKDRLLAPFAIGRIIKKFWLPGIIGGLLINLAIWLKLNMFWLITGLVLAAPVLWCAFIAMFIFIPLGILLDLWDRIRGKRKPWWN